MVRSLEIELTRLCFGTESADTVGTTGRLEIEPNAVNSVPREARLEIDIRDVDQGRRDAVVKEIQDEVVAIATRRKVKHTFEIVNQDPPETCSSQASVRIHAGKLLNYSCTLQSTNSDSS